MDEPGPVTVVMSRAARASSTACGRDSIVGVFIVAACLDKLWTVRVRDVFGIGDADSPRPVRSCSASVSY